ncbi:MAG: anaerobic ribonucleoside-triphosphate reductase activating protein [Clostridia bacterium]|nr:anaerobic ribonucleoside-triphosphate reductase activating protein [Clostridia bacterium]
MLIKGLQKTTLLDYPSKVAATVFTGGCNFRCPFCHNASLVTKITPEDEIPEEEILAFLKKRKGILDGVCITGGEPLLQKDISEFCKKIHELGLLVKLDTNGSRPNELGALITDGLIDYIAMDVKNSKALYAKTCGIASFPKEVEESVGLIMSSGLPYEFRTTVVRELQTAESISELCQWISGAERYYLQLFKDSGDLVGNGYSAYSADEMTELLKIAKQYIKNAELRGI